MSNNSKLRQLASVLPYYPKIRNGKPVITYHFIMGDELLKKNPDQKDKTGKAISTKTRYRQAIVLCEDHFERLKSAFKENGEQGIKDYCELVRSYKTKTSS
jgi:hypothetical protein